MFNSLKKVSTIIWLKYFFFKNIYYNIKSKLKLFRFFAANSFYFILQCLNFKKWRYIFFFSKSFKFFFLKKTLSTCSYGSINFKNKNVKLFLKKIWRYSQKKKYFFKQKNISLNQAKNFNIFVKQKSPNARLFKFFRFFFLNFKAQKFFLCLNNINIKLFFLLSFFFLKFKTTLLIKYANNWTRVKIKIFRNIKKRLWKKKIKKLFYKV